MQCGAILCSTFKAMGSQGNEKEGERAVVCSEDISKSCCF